MSRKGAKAQRMRKESKEEIFISLLCSSLRLTGYTINKINETR